MHQLWQNVQADEFLSLWKPFNSDELHPRFIPLSCCTSWYQWGASKAAAHGTGSWAQGPGIRVLGTGSWTLEFWARAPFTNMNCFTHVSITGLVAHKEPRMPNVCVGVELPQLVWPFIAAIWKGQDFQIPKSSWWDLLTILMSRGHFPAWTDLHVTGTADLMGSLSSTSPLWKNEALLPEPCLFALRIPACLNCC